MRGPTDVPQLAETIGACLARTVQVCACVSRGLALRQAEPRVHAGLSHVVGLLGVCRLADGRHMRVVCQAAAAARRHFYRTAVPSSGAGARGAAMQSCLLVAHIQRLPHASQGAHLGLPPSPACVLLAPPGVQAFPDNDAVVSVHQGVRLSYRQFHEQVEEAACGLLALGIQVRPAGCCGRAATTHAG